MGKKIPELVSGGIVSSGGLAIVHAGEPIIPLSKLKELIGDVEVEPRKNNIVIHVNMDNFDEEKIKELAEIINDRIRNRSDVPRNYRPS